MSKARPIRLNRGRMLALIETRKALAVNSTEYDLYEAEIIDEIIESRFTRSRLKALETPRRRITIVGREGCAGCSFKSEVVLEGTSFWEGQGGVNPNTVWTVTSVNLA